MQLAPSLAALAAQEAQSSQTRRVMKACAHFRGWHARPWRAPLFPRLPLEAHVRLDLESRRGAADALGERVELRHAECEAVVWHGHRVVVDGVDGRGAGVAVDLVRNNLVAKQVEVDPPTARRLAVIERLPVQ
jgi:hypothetical protein